MKSVVGRQSLVVSLRSSAIRQRPLSISILLPEKVWRKYSRGGPLGNNEFAAVLFFQCHGTIQRDDGALGLVVRRRLGGDALKPEARRGHEREQRSAVP